jgi:MFS family permease
MWGRLSDKIGRKPVLLIGLFGNSITMLTFGFSHSLTWAILTRSACGLLNGNIGVAKSVIGEITTAKNRGAAFSLIGLVNGLGLIIGTTLGGMLSWPDQVFPDIFGGVQIFIDNPFLLPCMCSSMISFLGFSIGFFFLPETLKKHTEEELQIEDVDVAVESTEHLLDQSDIETPLFESEVSTEHTPLFDQSDSLLESEVKPVDGSVALQAAIGYALIAFENIVFAEVLPLWSIAPPPIGLGFTAVQIGLLLSSVGVVAIICQLIIYPVASRYFTAITLYRVPIVGLLVIFIFIPFIPYLSNDVGLVKYVWPCLILAMGVKSITENFIFTSVMVLVIMIN